MEAQVTEETKRETGPETIDKMTQGDNVTLDLYFDRHPNTMTLDDYRELVRMERKRRADRIAKKEG